MIKVSEFIKGELEKRIGMLRDQLDEAAIRGDSESAQEIAAKHQYLLDRYQSMYKESYKRKEV